MKIRALGILIFVGYTLLFTACSERKYFEPYALNGIYKFTKKLPAKIVAANRNTALLKNGVSISSGGITNLRLKKHESFLGESNGYYIVVNSCEYLTLVPKDAAPDIAKTLKQKREKKEAARLKEDEAIAKGAGDELALDADELEAKRLASEADKKEADKEIGKEADKNEIEKGVGKESIRERSKEERLERTYTISTDNKEAFYIPTKTCAIAVSISDDKKAAMVLIDNTIALYDFANSRQLFSTSNINPLAINQLVATPEFLDTMILYPTLDGRIIVVNKAAHTVVKNLLIGDLPYFNNILYLYTNDRVLIALNQKRLIAIKDGKEYTYEATFRDAKYYKGHIYALTLDGDVLELDENLEVTNHILLPYATLSGLIFDKGYLYTVDIKGTIIKIELKTFDVSSYKTNLKAKRNLFYTNDMLYYDKYIIDFAHMRPKKIYIPPKKLRRKKANYE